jgi:LmbE family N-acetylglucosaminyl deacetylase
MPEPLTLMAVHAHPDDEAVATGGVLARAAAEKITTVVVTCTNGEFGDGPEGVKPGAEGHDEVAVAATRRIELEESCRQLGVAHLEMLGYHDSGMADWDYRQRPDVFCNVPSAESTARLVALLERYRPDVVITYEEESMYDHPDHVQTSRITKAAVAESGIPAKLYYIGLTFSGWGRVRKILEEKGVEMPAMPDLGPEALQRMAATEARITTTVDVSAYLNRKQASVTAHASQFRDSFFTKLTDALPPAALLEVFGSERFIRATDRTGAPLPETDLFAGLR